MVHDALKTLFHPFESGMLAAPPAGARVLFLGAEPGFRLPVGFDCQLSLVQGFRPDFLMLQQHGHGVAARAEGGGYAAALVLCGRHRGQNEVRIAEALDRVADGGLVLVAGARDDGIASLAKRLGKLLALNGQSPKHHGLAFWLAAPPGRATIAAGLRQANSHAAVDGRFETAPGMFSHDRIDPGSKLLAEALPAELSGAVADFCAGWGYLSAALATRCPNVSSVDLYEADFDSIEAARRNLAGVGGIETRSFWHDLLSEPVEPRYDAIVMNPPFHHGRAAEPEIGRRLIGVAASALKQRGTLFTVANRQLPYERALSAVLPKHEEIAGDRMFKVFAARR